MSILPSSYAWFLLPPKADLELIDNLALKGLFPTLQDLYPSIAFAILLGFTRVILTPLLLKPFAMYARGIPPLSWKADPSIEAHIPKKNSKAKEYLSVSEVKVLATITQKTTVAIEAYLKAKRIDAIRQTKITKFVEAFWRFLLYSTFTIIGCNYLFYPSPVSWIFNSRELYLNWPHHGPIDGFIFYHNLQLGCYIHLLMWTEVLRADSIVDIIHHVVTIILILLSHTQMLLRTGTATFMLHDVSDIFLESAKCFNYAAISKGHKFARTSSDVLFALFAFSFFALRLVWYPRLIVFGMLFRAKEVLGEWPGLYVSAALLSLLVVLHVYWGYLILKMVISLLSEGINKDVRSDDEEEEDVVTVIKPDTATAASTPAKVSDGDVEADGNTGLISTKTVTKSASKARSRRPSTSAEPVEPTEPVAPVTASKSAKSSKARSKTPKKSKGE